MTHCDVANRDEDEQRAAHIAIVDVDGPHTGGRTVALVVAEPCPLGREADISGEVTSTSARG